MYTHTETLDKHATQIDVYTQAHTAQPPPPPTHTHTCACTERAHTQCVFTQHVHRDNKHTTLCDNNTGRACIKSGVHQIHTHTYHYSLT